MGKAWKDFWALISKLFGVVGKVVDMTDHLANAGVTLAQTAEDITSDYKHQSKAEREAEHASIMRTINEKRALAKLPQVEPRTNPAIKHAATQQPSDTATK